MIGWDGFLNEVGFNFVEGLIFVGKEHIISHPLAKDFPWPVSILFRNARILFFSL